MEYFSLGQTDIRVSRIGLGCVTFGREIDELASFTVADRALERGVTMFDTAETYHKGESERVLGRWMRDRGVRDRVVLATKAAGPFHQARIIAAADASLRNLQTDRIDLYYLHSHPGDDLLAQSLEALDVLVQHGKVRAVGCSNFNADQLRGAIDLQRSNGWTMMAALQPIYNLVARDIEAATIPLCQRARIAVVSYSPLGAGFLTGKYHRGAPVPAGARFDVIPGHQNIYFHDEKWRTMERLRDKARELGEPMHHLALAWVLGRPGVTTVLIGARNPAQVDQAFETQHLLKTLKDDWCADL